MRNLLCGMAATLLSIVFALSAVADEGQKYTLRYKFHPGETIRWEVEHRSMIRADRRPRNTQNDRDAEQLGQGVAGGRRCSPTAPPRSSTASNGSTCGSKLTGPRGGPLRQPHRQAAARRASRRVAKSVGVPLVDRDDGRARQGARQRERLGQAEPRKAESPKPAAPWNESWVTIPLPARAGGRRAYSGRIPQAIDIPLEGGMIKQIKAVQQFVLEEVKTGVATIRVSTEVLTPVTDPAVESQLVEREASGTVRFDIDAGRILGQEMDIDKHVVGFRGDASSIHYVNRFSERLLPEPGRR